MMILLSVAELLAKDYFLIAVRKLRVSILNFGQKSVGKLSPEIINSYF
jgi:hypothetical protein